MEPNNFVGQEIQGYKISKPIGQGKFSTVYKAEDSQGQPFAVKKIKIFDMMDPKQREKCLKEVELMKPLSHPNIIQYVDSFTHNNELIIVTEWAEKGDLKRLIKEHQADETPFEEIRIWEFLIQISSALKHMHEKRIMHRDLKPANIFIAQDDTLKVGDLGLGRAFGSQTIEAHSKVGTPLYMSPELLRDQGYQSNADVWSLGCIAYELVELRSPFRNENEKMSLMDLFNNITRGEYKPISNRYSPELADLIKKMIIVDPNRRLSSAEVLEISEQNFAKMKRTPKIDSYIVMQDIISKLNLIDYPNFCKITDHKPIHRAYFAFQDPKSENNEQLNYFLEMGYWIMNLSKVDRSKDKAASQAKSMIDWKSVEGACNKFLADVQTFGIKHEMLAKNIIQGYGQNVCYLLNQLLNRELIRVNFKFKVPDQISNSSPLKQLEDSFQQMQVDQNLLFDNKKDEKDEDIEETLEFQRSVLFKRGKKIGDGEHDKLLDMINEIDERDTSMIVGKADQKQWEKECAKVDKQLSAISAALKEGRKRPGLDNFQRIKFASGKINDVIDFVKPTSYRLYEQTQRECDKIVRGEKIINNELKGLGQEFGQKNARRLILVDRLSKQTNYANEKVQQLEALQSKLQSVNSLADKITSSDKEQPVVKLRQAIKNMRQELKEADTRTGLLQWQLRKYLVQSKQKQPDNIEYYDEGDNSF